MVRGKVTLPALGRLLAAACTALLVGVPGLLVSRAAAQGPVLPGHFEAVTLPGTFTVAVNLAFADDGTLFIAKKTGEVRVVNTSGQIQPAYCIDLSNEVNNDHDRGLLGIALHPGFTPDDGPTSWLYLVYTVSPVPGQDLTYNQDQKYSFSRLTRYRVKRAGGSLAAVLGSRQVLLGHQLADGSVPDGIASLHHSHSNGSLHFASDGSLLLSTGDGAHYDLTDTGGFDEPGFDDFTHPVTGLRGPTPAVEDSGAFRSQDLRSLAGKVLRIDPATGLGYPSNPFFDGNPASSASRVWALGLRNPYRTTLIPGTGSTDPSLGQPEVMLIGDVGQNAFEELDLCRGGENFAWPCYEAVQAAANYQAFDPPGVPAFPNCNSALDGVLTAPLVAWHHLQPGKLEPPGIHVDGSGNPTPGFIGSCVAGGTFYTGGSYPAEYAGRLFCADYEEGWIKTVELDATQQIVAVRDFASGLGAIVDLARHPVTGDLYYLDVVQGKLTQIRYGANLTPVAVVEADVAGGPAPLLVHFTGSGSSDPDGDDLIFDWDFGDGTPHSSAPDPLHVYATDGAFAATLSVTDPGGLGGTSDPLQIAVAPAPLTARITSPLPGHLFEAPEDLLLDGEALNPGPGALSFQWTADLYHDTHVHPGSFLSGQQQTVFNVDSEEEEGAVIYYRIELRVTDGTGATDATHVFVFPASAVVDVSGTSLPITRMEELSPPYALGNGHPDPEIMRDGRLPPVGSGELLQQFASFHGGAQGEDDWIGYELSFTPDDALRFVSLQFQEGLHFQDGGWFEDLAVEVRNGATWAPATNLKVLPAYPFALARQAFFDGVAYQTYELHFDPTLGDAVRLRGTPGGAAGFITCGELRARLVGVHPPPSLHADITTGGTVLAKVFSLVPPGPQGVGSKDPLTVANGTLPPVGSASQLAQYDTFHFGDQGDEDWIGYDFGATRTFTQLVFQEGLHFSDGGAFQSLGVQIQQTPGGPWVAAGGLSVAPPYTGLDATSYETFTLEFAPTLGRAIRLVGPPAGARRYVSVGELGVRGPRLAEGCGWESYGNGVGGPNTLLLASQTPPGLGLPIEISASGAAGPANGRLGVALGSAAFPWQGGLLLVDPASLILIPISFDAAGSFVLGTMLPGDVVLAGVEIWLQAFALGQPLPFPIRLSNGLKLTLCAW